MFDLRARAIEELLKTQKDALDRTDNRFIKRLDDTQGIIDASLLHLQRLMEEKFKGVDQQFQGRDVALAAALLAQKTSVDEQNKANAASAAKQEGAITKQIDGIQAIIMGNQKGTDDKIDGAKALLANQAKTTDDKIAELRNSIVDLRTATTAITSRGAGQNDLWAYMVAGAGFLVAFLGFLLPRMNQQQRQAPQYPYPYPYPYPEQQHRQPAPQVSVVPVVPVAVPNA